MPRGIWTSTALSRRANVGRAKQPELREAIRSGVQGRDLRRRRTAHRDGHTRRRGRPRKRKSDQQPRCSATKAIQAIPFDKLSREMRYAGDTTVINNTSIYRRLPTQSIDCDPDLFVFLLRNPEVVVDIWRVMGITNMTLDRSGPDRYRAADGQGTTGIVDFAYRSSDLHVIYSEGTYDGPMYPTKLRGQCVIVLKSSYARDANGHMHVTNRLDAFLRIENLGAEIVAKTLQPLLGKTADHNFSETSSFVGSLSHTAETNPNGVGRLAQKLNHVEPQVRQQFADLAGHAADNAAVAEALADPATEGTSLTRRRQSGPQPRVHPSGTAESPRPLRSNRRLAAFQSAGGGTSS